jgi:taurine dioxygenase
MTALNIGPLSAHVGAELSDIDLRRLNEESFNVIRDTVAQRGVLIVRDQELTPEDHIAFAKRWGGIDVNTYFPANGTFPEIAEVRKSEAQTVNIGGGWHTDHSYDQIPAMGSILLAREVPPVGGDTLFASMGAAYDSLSAGLKTTLRSLRALHSADHIYGPNGAYAATDQAADLKGQELKTGAVHPVIIQHPITGRQLLYVNPAFTLHFEGWSRMESMPLLNYLYQIAMQEEFHCRLQWTQGSIAIWDNLSTWHFAQNDYQGHRRLMHRITLSGVPIS